MGRKLWKRSAAAVFMLIVLSTGLVANAEESCTVNGGGTVQTAETVPADTVMTLEQWAMSEDHGIIEESLNEIMQDLGMIVELKADGNTLVFAYHFPREIWGDVTAVEINGMGTSDEVDSLVEELSELLEEMVESLGQGFDAEYGIKLDGVCFVYVAPDGVPFYSMVVEIGQTD